MLQILQHLFPHHLEPSGIQPDQSQLYEDQKPKIQQATCSARLPYTDSTLQHHEQIGVVQADMPAGLPRSISKQPLVTQNGL